MLLSSLLKLPLAPVSSHQSRIPCFAVAARKRKCQLLHSNPAGGRGDPRFGVQHLEHEITVILFTNQERDKTDPLCIISQKLVSIAESQCC